MVKKHYREESAWFATTKCMRISVILGDYRWAEFLRAKEGS